MPGIVFGARNTRAYFLNPKSGHGLTATYLFIGMIEQNRGNFRLAQNNVGHMKGRIQKIIVVDL